jgi:hypothetical protein
MGQPAKTSEHDPTESGELETGYQLETKETDIPTEIESDRQSEKYKRQGQKDGQQSHRNNQAFSL